MMKIIGVAGLDLLSDDHWIWGSRVYTAAGTSFGRDVGPPSWPLAASGITVTTSAILFWIPLLTSGPFAVHLAGWILGAFLPVWFMVGFRLHDRRRRRRRNYVEAGWSGSVALLTFAGVLIGGYHGWLLAYWWAS
jgi:hypothetical protein